MTAVRGSVEQLRWASEAFARRCGRVDLDPTAPPLTPARLTGYDIVEAAVPATRPELADGLADLGFRLADGAVDLLWPHPVDGERAPCRAARLPDVPALRDLAANTLRRSRFRPPWYTAEERRTLYRSWVENAVRGTFDHVCLLPADGTPAFVTVRALDDGSARVGLLTVADAATGRGVGGALVDAARHWCADRGLDPLRVTTQTGNLPAIRLYTSRGARVAGIRHWMYR
ncbi:MULTISPECIES: dTDP-4-amino-4,6-dideoxy-D-galactose acyltransferase [Actinosynnema]|uniref:dTDP-4-amino-4,6-dideoxy-D-galactose acyltransferase n=1 Tax=Actinosynnema TaxID=40566 RepID=UPI0020A46746|nr:dTDP-4-amino-4,6-dideoxy-D-galactose acyltransferase [Actinosynnema pretiosum]MCP2098817.1 dTDP-4-amino-4,6-dideoxy-D-galactose acyltransferase [Actinosynnema pretiosum]